MRLHADEEDPRHDCSRRVMGSNLHGSVHGRPHGLAQQPQPEGMIHGWHISVIEPLPRHYGGLAGVPGNICTCPRSCQVSLLQAML
jgi:hypothetical protein